MGRTLALAACLIAAAVIAWWGERTPRPLPASAPAPAFAAARAFADIAVIGRAPHPTGSPANAAVRAYLLQRMAALGLDPQAREADVFVDYPRAQPYPTLVGGRVVSLVGVLPGRDRRLPAVAIMAHYDSVPASPGAADDAAGVAAALETVRALKAQGPLRRDVVVVFTDGEEVDLLGARDVFAHDPLARRIGFAVNLEARGGGGRARMFQTGPANGKTIALFRRAAVSPSASSLAVHLYERMPNDTDFSVARAAGIPGLNFAFIGRQFDYHSASSTPAALDLGAVQDIGRQMLAVTREAAEASALPGPAPDWAFSQLPGGYLLAYPAIFGWGVLAAAAALLAVAVRRAAGAVAARDVARGIGAALFLLIGSAAVLHAARRASGAGFGFLEQHRLLAQAPRFEAAMILLAVGVLLYAAAELARGRRGIAFVALAAGVAGAAFSGFEPLSLGLGGVAVALALIAFRRPTAAAGAWTGLLLTGFVAALALQVAAPPAAPIVAWPLALGAALAALSGLWTRRSWPVRLVTVAGATLGLAWLGGVAHGVHQGLDAPEALALVVWLAALVVWPLAQPDKDVAGTPFVAVAVLLSGVAVLALVRWDEPWSARHPRASEVAYHQDLSTGEAFRVSAAPERNAWSAAVLAADGGSVRSRAVPLVFGLPVAAAPARPVAAPAPVFTLARMADGRVALTAQPPPDAAILNLEIVPAVALAEMTVQGAPSRIVSGPGSPFRLRWQGAPGAITLAFRPAGPGAITVRYAAVTPGWPAQARPLPPRPTDVMAFGLSDSTIVTGVQRLTW